MSIEDLLPDQEPKEQDPSPEPGIRTPHPSMGDLLSETDQLFSRVNQNVNLMEKIDNVASNLESIAATVAQEGALNDYNRRVIAAAFKGLTGSNLLQDRVVALEDDEGADDAFKDEALDKAQEGTLAEFVVTLKRMFYDNWGDTKNWYSKSISLRDAVSRKNKDTREAAAKIQGDPKTPEFIYKENLDVDNDGKVSHQELVVGLQAMLTFTERRLTAKVDKDYEDYIVGCQHVVDGYKTKAEVDESELLRFKNLYTPSPEVLTSPVEDKALRSKLTDSETAELIQSRPFPGNTFVVMSKPAAKSGSTPYSFIEDTWIRLYTEETEEKEGVKVRTFYPNQIIYIADIVEKLIDSLLYFDKSWERRDRFMGRVFSSLDKTVSVISSKLTDSTQDQKTDEQLRGLTRIMIKSIQLDNTFNVMLINHVIKIAAQCDELSRACLLQYSEQEPAA